MPPACGYNGVSDSLDSVRNTAPFFVLAKPSGPACNLRCSYCFYLEKKDLFGRTQSTRMSDGTLETFIRDYIGTQDTPEITFAWQGGEPTLRGLDFYRKVLELQRAHAQGRRISNAFQTNGVLIDAEWAEFFAENGFLVGISIDGPADLHDAHRVDAAGRGSLAAVLTGLGHLQANQVDFNTLTVVSRANARHARKVYRFLKDIGSRYIQFIPLVERRAKGAAPTRLAGPPGPGPSRETEVTRWSVSPLAYGDFLIDVFREWVRRDVGSVFVQTFDNALASWVGAGARLCVFAETCGRQLAIEHDGSVYACDHYVYPQYRLGNVKEQSFADMLDSNAQRRFGAAKRDTLPTQCRTCEVRFACNGGCPKQRFLHTADGEAGLNYLCAGYRKFFRFVDPPMRAMGQLLRQGRAPAEIMQQRGAPGMRSGGRP
jgi:uncharacterized protein